jgi:hypothetical protein
MKAVVKMYLSNASVLLIVFKKAEDGETHKDFAEIDLEAF